MKIIAIVVILLIIGAVGLYFYEGNIKETIKEGIYQGPIPEGYDEEHFRKTGETKTLSLP